MSHLKIAVAAATVLLATTACGGSPEEASATDQTLGSAPQGGTLQQGGPGGAGFPGASGTIAAVSGTTLQVQNPMEGQVAVRYTKATTFTEQVDVDGSALEVGDCVMVTGEGTADATTDPLTASSVRITPAGDDGCSIGRPDGVGAPQFQGGPPPGDLPSDLPDGAVMMSGAFGEVTAVGKNGFTVEMTLPGSDDATTREVTTSDDTTWTDTIDADSKAVKVGRCASAQGDRDDTGGLQATSIAISDPVDGQCGMTGMFRAEAGG